MNRSRVPSFRCAGGAKAPASDQHHASSRAPSRGCSRSIPAKHARLLTSSPGSCVSRQIYPLQGYTSMAGRPAPRGGISRRYIRARPVLGAREPAKKVYPCKDIGVQGCRRLSPARRSGHGRVKSRNTAHCVGFREDAFVTPRAPSQPRGARQTPPWPVPLDLPRCLTWRAATLVTPSSDSRSLVAPLSPIPPSPPVQARQPRHAAVPHSATAWAGASRR